MGEEIVGNTQRAQELWESTERKGTESSPTPSQLEIQVRKDCQRIAKWIFLFEYWVLLIPSQWKCHFGRF